MADANGVGIADAAGGLDLDVDRSGNAVVSYLTSSFGTVRLLGAVRSGLSGAWQILGLIARWRGSPDVAINSRGDAAIVWASHGEIASPAEFVEVAEWIPTGPLL